MAEGHGYPRGTSQWPSATGTAGFFKFYLTLCMTKLRVLVLCFCYFTVAFGHGHPLVLGNFPLHWWVLRSPRPPCDSFIGKFLPNLNLYKGSFMKKMTQIHQISKKKSSTSSDFFYKFQYIAKKMKEFWLFPTFIFNM